MTEKKALEVITITHVHEVVALVSSESTPGAFYRVTMNRDGHGPYIWTCTCPDFKHRKERCKHIEAAQDELI